MGNAATRLRPAGKFAQQHAAERALHCMAVLDTGRGALDTGNAYSTTRSTSLAWAMRRPGGELLHNSTLSAPLAVLDTGRGV
jgi:hypothetical protein